MNELIPEPIQPPHDAYLQAMGFELGFLDSIPPTGRESEIPTDPAKHVSNVELMGNLRRAAS